ncbi:lipopolysaccharide biosynthesis protein [Vibrio harveyi]|uniref:lipopolysaccharide biosynthesis protein n=1 Tax=Vibrio harveyi TaxID=669 RepID=UPI00165D5C53|nr:polysaccharide biosynthesis C-terminal domain-containing protein [Vibrio harveyi]
MMSHNRFKSFVGFFFGTVLSTFLGVSALHVINKNLEPYELGVFSYNYNLLQLLYPLISLSIYTSYIRFINESPVKDLINYVRKVSVCGVIIMSSGIYFFSREEEWLLFSIIILLQERLYLYKALNRIGYYNLINVFQKIILLILLFFTNSLNAKNVIFCYSLSFLLSWLLSLSLIKLNREVTRENSKVLTFKKNKILRYTLLSSIMTGVTWVSSFSDQYVIKYYFGFEELAPYAVAFRLVSVISIATSIFLSYFPIIYFEDANKKIYSSIKSYRFGFFISLAMLYVFCYFTYEYIYILLGAGDYIEEHRYFFILLIGEIFRVLASTYMIYFTYRLKQGFILFSMTIISILNLLLNVILIPKFGPISAAFTTVFSYFIYFVISLRCYFLERRYFLTIDEV